MKSSIRLLSVFLPAAAVIALSIAFSSVSAADPSDALFRDLILQRVKAHSRGDLAAYRRLLDKDFVHIDDAGNRRVAAEMSEIAQANDSEWVLGKSHTRLVSPTLAVVDCEVTELLKFGPRRLQMPLHEMDIFILRSGKWLFLEHAETHALDQPKPISLSQDQFNDFVGFYEWWPGYQETISLHDNRLYVQATGDTAPTPMLAAGADAFFVQGDASLSVFVRGSDGKVSKELTHFPDGKVVIARKVE